MPIPSSRIKAVDDDDRFLELGSLFYKLWNRLEYIFITHQTFIRIKLRLNIITFGSTMYNYGNYLICDTEIGKSLAKYIICKM